MSEIPAREPVTVALRRLFDETGCSLRAAATKARELDETGKGFNHTYISAVLSGREKPSPRSLELMARVFNLEPEFFAEYRMWKARARIDPDKVGFDAALQRLDEIDGETPAEEPPLAHPV